MEDNMMPQTRESERQLNEWIEQTRDNENAVLMNAENLLETLTGLENGDDARLLRLPRIADPLS